MGGEGVQWTHQPRHRHSCAFDDDPKCCRHAISPSLKTHTPLHTNSPTRPTVCLATFVDVDVVVYIPSMTERMLNEVYAVLVDAEKGNGNLRIGQI